MIMNLISVRALTRDNLITVEFDINGFSVKALPIGMVILRSDNSDNLYLIVQSSQPPLPHTLFVLTLLVDLWHQRLGHPGRAILASVLGSFDFTCTKSAPSMWHEWQLGKHTRLPFTSSTSCTIFPFQLVYYDVWTSLVLSNFGFQYYLVILNDFTHFVWTFPLCHKSDVLHTILSFHAFIRT